MKLWHKIFLLTFVLFVVAFDAGIYWLTSLSYRTAITTAHDQAFMEYGFVAQSVTADVTAITSRGDGSASSLASLFTTSQHGWI